MVCSNKLVLHTQQWPGYEMKRHHVGKSFQTRVQHCLHYVLRRKAEVESVSEGNSPPLSILELIAQRRIAQLTASLLQDEVSKTTVSEVLPNSPTPQEVSAEVPTAADENNRAKKKRKALQLVETMFQVIVNKDTAINSYECLQCQKLFPTEQGVKTHCYKIHILENSMAPSSSGKLQDVETNVKTEYKCEQCERIFPNEEAIQQHRIAKHEGNFTYIAAASAGYKSGVSTSEVDRNKTEEAFQCSICQWKFASEEALQNHLQQGVIPVSTVASHSTATTSATEDSNNVKFQCSFCSKVLRDERAWKQHTNFCQLRHQNKTTSSTNL